MIKLNWKLGEQSGVLFVPDNVIIVESEGRTFVSHSLDSHSEGIEVKESPEEVAKKVLDYKALMMQYPVYLARKDYSHAKQLRDKLVNLAGLEE